MNTTSNLSLEHELEQAVNLWVDRSFNFIQLNVLEKYTDNSLHNYIRPISEDDVFEDWICQMNILQLIQTWTEDEDVEIDFLTANVSSKSDFISCFGDEHWESFENWCKSNYESDIQEYTDTLDNYPVWSTVFEFRDSFRNNEEDIQRCINMGLGIIEGLDDFNLIVFMTSAGHSFMSAYWIPLYLEFFPDEKIKYAGIDYSHI